MAPAPVLCRWNAGAHQLLRDLVRVRAQRAPPAVRSAASSAWARRWWGRIVHECLPSAATTSTWRWGAAGEKCVVRECEGAQRRTRLFFFLLVCSEWNPEDLMEKKTLRPCWYAGRSVSPTVSPTQMCTCSDPGSGGGRAEPPARQTGVLADLRVGNTVVFFFSRTFFLRKCLRCLLHASAQPPTPPAA